MKNSIMTHVVAGYPTYNECIEIITNMHQAGVTAIEIQIPYSDPIADGPTIMMANAVSLNKGMTSKRTFEMIKTVREQGVDVPIYVMTYLNKIVSYGLDQFHKDVSKAGTTGLIIPDMPFDCPEYEYLNHLAKEGGSYIVPVLSPGITERRLSGYNLKQAKLIYLTSRRGTTGSVLNIDTGVSTLINKIRSSSTAKIALGFGIKTTDDVQKALNVADIAVVGSAITQIIAEHGNSSATKLITSLVGDIA